MAHDHKHNEHKRKECDHKEHDHKEHDHKEHDHKEHDQKCSDHKDNDHKDHDHKAHEHKDHEHKDMVHGQDKSESNSHSHSHDHGGDCDECPAKKMKTTSANDVKDVDLPEWKKKALAMATSTSATDAPFGGSWNMESSVDATKDTSAKAAESAMDTGHDHGNSNGHGHTHEHMDHPGNYSERPSSEKRDYSERSFTVGLGGPVGSGKTALMLALCKRLREKLSLAAVTNDIFTREDGEFLTKNEALPKERIVAVETGGCPHAAIREDISANLHACEQLTATFAKPKPLDVVLLESGGDNLAANFSPELADFTVYVIDVAGGDKVPRKGGPGVTQSDVLVINKTDLAKAVGASLEVMERDAKRMRGEGPTVFAQAREGLDSTGVDKIMNLILDAWRKATSS